MDTRTGEIVSETRAAAVPAAERKFFVPMKLPPTPKQAKNRRVGRNDQCPCKSGKKFKKCCLVKMEKRRPKVKTF